jgi:hypothetical protein
MLTVGHDFGAWYVNFVVHQPPLGSPPQALPKLPAGFAVSLALVTVFFLFFSGAMAVGVGQASLHRETGVAAFRDGIAGAFKNVLPLVVLAICVLLAFLVLAVLLGFVGAIVIGLVFLASKVLGVIIGVAVYIAFILFMMAIMMGVNYAMWHDVTDAGHIDPVSPPTATVEE